MTGGEGQTPAQRLSAAKANLLQVRNQLESEARRFQPGDAVRHIETGRWFLVIALRRIYREQLVFCIPIEPEGDSWDSPDGVEVPVKAFSATKLVLAAYFDVFDAQEGRGG